MPTRRAAILTARREFLAGAGALAAVSIPVIACARQRQPAPSRSSRLIAGTSCPATPRQTEGPFYFDPRLVRQDVTEGRPGVPLRLRLQLVSAADCAPSERARVDIWHSDSAGDYSGYDSERTAGETWLRGIQFSEAEGIAQFTTIYPGWYRGRAPHIHVKAQLADGRELTSQIYFPDELSDRIYSEAPYSGRSGRRLRNGDDGIFRRLGGRAPIAEMTRAAGGYDAAVVIALT